MYCCSRGKCQGNWVESDLVISRIMGNGTPLQYSCLENPMDEGAWWATVHAVAKSWTQLSDFTFTFHFHALEKEMATHSSVLTWRIPGTGEPGRLPSVGLHRVRDDWSNLAAAAKFIAALFTIARTWKEPRCPWTDEWTVIYLYTHKGIYLAIKGMYLSQF